MNDKRPPPRDDTMSPSTSQPAPGRAVAPEHHVGTMQEQPVHHSSNSQPQLHYNRCDVYQPHQHGREGDDTMSLSTSQPAPGRAVAPEHHVDNSAYNKGDNIFSIILLGLSGTGKSASANTILKAMKSNLEPEIFFKSESSSMPVTTKCQCRIVDTEFGSLVRVVDTPDFLNDHHRNSQEQIEECKKFCQRGRCVVLLVMKVGRFTETEILQKLENKLGWNIRESTIVLQLLQQLSVQDDNKLLTCWFYEWISDQQCLANAHIVALPSYYITCIIVYTTDKLCFINILFIYTHTFFQFLCLLWPSK